MSAMTIAELAVSIGLKTDEINSKLDKILGNAEKKTLGWAAKIGKSLNKEIGEKLGGALKVGALAGAAAFGVAFKDALDFDALLGDIAIGSNGAVGSIELLREKILKLSKATGVAKEEVANGVKKFVELTGDGKAAAEAMETFARVSVATKAEMSDIAEVAATLSQKFGLLPKDFEKSFSILIAGGKAGSVEFKNMAALLAEVGAAGVNFKGMTGTEGLADLAAAFQLVRQGFGGPQGANKAATSLVALMGEIGDKSKALKKHGIRVWEKDPTGKLVRRNFQDIVKSIGKLDAKKRTEIFGLDAAKALDELIRVDGAWEKLSETTKKANDTEIDFAKRQALASKKAADAWNAVKVSVAEAFTPERLQAFAELLAKTLSIAVDLAGWIGAVLGMDHMDNQDASRGVDDFVLSKKGKRGNYEQGLRELVSAAESDDVGQLRGYFGKHADSTHSMVGTGDGAAVSIERLAQSAKQKLRTIENQRKVDAARTATRATIAGLAGAPGAPGKTEVDVKVSLDSNLLKAEVKKTTKAETQAMLREAAAGTSGQEAVP